MFLKFWNDHKKEIIEGVFVGLILAAIFGVRSCLHKNRETVEKDKEAKEEVYYGRFSAYFQISYNLCLSLLKENYCPVNIEIILKDLWLENLKDPNEKRHVEGFFADLAAYNQGCSSLSVTDQKEQVNNLYFRSKRDPYIIYHYEAAARTFDLPDYFGPDIRKPPSVKAEECDIYLQNVAQIKKHEDKKLKLQRQKK